MLVSPQHLFLMRLTHGGEEVLAPAVKSLRLPGVTREPDVVSIDYFNILTFDHDVIRANGRLVETALADAHGARLSPVLNHVRATRPMIPARRILRRIADDAVISPPLAGRWAEQRRVRACGAAAPRVKGRDVIHACDHWPP